MMSLNESGAANAALAITKIILANPSCKIIPDKTSANDVADFISTLADRLTQKQTEE